MIPAINKVQLAQEATFKTPQTPAIQPNGLDVKITPKSETEQLDSKDGTTMPAKYSFIKRRWSEVSIEGPLDYNRSLLWLDGLFGQDASSPHTYAADEDAAVTPKGLTCVYGQTGAIFQVAGIVPRTMTIKGASGEPWQFVMDGFGLPVSDGASFETLTTDVPELVHGYDTTLYMDEDLSATIGTTERADVAFRFEAKITANHEPIWHLGDQTWDSIRQGKWGGSLKLVLEADATALDSLGDILDAVDSAKGFVIRLQATDGTNTIKLDFAGVCTDPPVLITDEDGVVTIELDLVPQWSSTLDSCWGAEVTIA